MSTEESQQAGPSTPSRKRSRWDVDDAAKSESPEQAQRPPIPKKRVKSKPPTDLSAPSRSQTPTAPPARVSAERTFKRPTHSVYVPPRTYHPPIVPSRSVYCYERLNSIEEGSYGVVFRARDKETGDIVALKKLKLEEEKHGFPITALREINALMTCRHENVVGIREVVVGDTLTQ